MIVVHLHCDVGTFATRTGVKSEDSGLVAENLHCAFSNCLPENIDTLVAFYRLFSSVFKCIFKSHGIVALVAYV